MSERSNRNNSLTLMALKNMWRCKFCKPKTVNKWVRGVGQWWGSSGLRVCLLFRRSEFESLSFNYLNRNPNRWSDRDKILHGGGPRGREGSWGGVKRTKINKKEAGVGPFLKKSVMRVPLEHQCPLLEQFYLLGPSWFLEVGIVGRFHPDEVVHAPTAQFGAGSRQADDLSRQGWALDVERPVAIHF